MPTPFRFLVSGRDRRAERGAPRPPRAAPTRPSDTGRKPTRPTALADPLLRHGESSGTADDVLQHPVEPTRHVVVVVGGSESFGIRTFLLTQLHHAERHGLSFGYLAVQDGECAAALRAAGASVSVAGGEIDFRPYHPALLPFLWLRSLPGLYEAFAGIRRFLQETPCRVLYAHSYYSVALCGLAGRGLDCRVVGQLHGNLNVTRLAGLQRILVSLVLAASAERLVAISDFAAASLWGPARRKACRIDNGIDVEAIIGEVQGVAKDPRRIVIVGRLVAWKKQEIAIRAIKFLRARGIDCKLEVIGGPVDPSDRVYRNLRELIVALGLADHVHFAGVLSPPYRRVASAAACVSCATREPFGLAVIEAAACGTAVVAADAGATAELIEDRKTGLLFRPDDPIALADALECLLQDGALRSSLAEAGRRRALERYDIARHLRALRRCLDAVLEQP